MDQERPSYARCLQDFAVEHSLGELEIASVTEACAAVTEKDGIVAAILAFMQEGNAVDPQIVGFIVSLTVTVTWLVSRGLWDEAMRYADNATAQVGDAAPQG